MVSVHPTPRDCRKKKVFQIFDPGMVGPFMGWVVNTLGEAEGEVALNWNRHVCVTGMTGIQASPNFFLRDLKTTSDAPSS